MSLRDDFAFDGQTAAEVQKAYDESGQYDFMGHKTEPWTVRRHSVALQLRSRLVTAINDENGCIDTFMKTGFYPHLFHDVVIVMYLLHLKKEHVVRLERMSEDAARDLAYNWAESIPLTYGSAPFFEATQILGKILKQIHVSWFQVRQKEGAESETSEKKSQDIAEHGKSKSSTVQSEPADIMPGTSKT
jgi:hypothetical protein